MTDVDNEAVIDSLREVYKKQAKSGSESDEPAAGPDSSDLDSDVEAEDGSLEVSHDGAEGDEDYAAADDEPEDEEPKEVFQAPEHWSSDDKEAFASLPDDAKQILIERDKSFQRGYQERVQAVSDLTKAVEPWTGHLAQMGVSEADAIRTLFATGAQIESDPINGIIALAQRYGVLDQLRELAVPDTDDEFADPEVKALRQQVNDLHAVANNFQQQQQMQQQHAVMQQQQELLGQIEDFKNQKDESGKLAHPYFDQVRQNMATFVNQGKSLEEAYNEAVWLVPEYRKQHIKSVGAKRAGESDQERAERVKQAKKAATANKTSGKKKAETSDESLSVKDELRAAWSNLS